MKINTFGAVLIATHECSDAADEEMSIPITVKRQFQICNLQTNNLKEYICISFFLLFFLSLYKLI